MVELKCETCKYFDLDNGYIENMAACANVHAKIRIRDTRSKSSRACSWHKEKNNDSRRSSVFC